MSEFIGPNYSKRVKQLMRALGETAYERELSRALQQLDADFAVWRSGSLSPVELTEKIRTFHDKTARELLQVVLDGIARWGAGRGHSNEHRHYR